MLARPLSLARSRCRLVSGRFIAVFGRGTGGRSGRDGRSSPQAATPPRASAIFS